MFKFASNISVALSALVLTTASIVTIGTITTKDVVVNDNMNYLQKSIVFQKNVNCMALFAIKTVVTKNETDFLPAFMSGWVSLPILAGESAICIIALLILKNQTKDF